MKSDRKRVPVVALSLLAVFVAYFSITFVVNSPPTHDYASYLKVWDVVLSGDSPWSSGLNAYGPVFSSLAPLYEIHFNLPRVFFAICWLGASVCLAIPVLKHKSLGLHHKYFLLLLLFLNPLNWICTLKYGTNDVLMAVAVTGSVAMLTRGSDLVAGLLMAVAILTKFIPVVMLPFLVFFGGQVRWRFAMSVTMPVVGAYVFCYLRWGDNVFYPFTMASDRGSKILSIFRFLRGEWSPLRLFIESPNLDWASTGSCMVALVALFIAFLCFRLEPLTTSVIALGVLLTLYKVGHPQFYITLVMLLVFWISYNGERLVTTPVDLTAVYTFIIWMAMVTFLYDLTQGYRNTGWRETLGLPHFGLSCWLLYQLLQFARQDSLAGAPHDGRSPTAMTAGTDQFGT